MRKILLLLATCLLTFKCLAIDYEAYKEVYIWFSPTNYVAYLCSDKPSLVIGETEWTLKANGTELAIPNTQTIKFTFPESLGDDADALKNIHKEGDVLINQQQVLLSSVTKGTLLTIYSMDGKLQLKQKAGADGAASINISHLHTGTYVMKAGTINLKFQKK